MVRQDGCMIQHLVVVKPRHPEGSAEESEFLKGCGLLATIPGVQNFELLRQVHPDTEYRLAFSMQFADQAAYDAYKVHPDHLAFVENVWKPAVEAGMDLDLVRLAPRGSYDQ
jgi:hypothetical protein